MVQGSNDFYPQGSSSGLSTLDSPVNSPTLPTATAGKSSHKRRTNQAFRFRLTTFLPGQGTFALRRFSITEAAFLLMMAYLTSRGLGVIRQTLFNILFGAGPQANAYYAAAYLPEILFDLVAGGALTHAFIPVFLSYEKDRGKYETWRLTSLVFNVLLVVLSLLSLAGELCAPAFVTNWLIPGYTPAEQALTIELTRVLLMQPILLGLGTVITAVLNSKQQFLLPALSVAIYNVGLIGGLGATFLFPGLGIYGPTWGILVATALQVLVMVPALYKQGARYSFVWDLKHPGLHEVLRLLIPNTLAVAITVCSPIIDTAFISYMPDTTSLAAQRNAYMLYGLPIALVALAVGQATLPRMAALATAQKYLRLRQTLLKVLRTSLIFSVLAALALCLLGQPAIHLLFEHGAFTSHATYVTYITVLGYAAALPGQAATAILILSFYALKNALVPFCSTLLAFLMHVGSIFFFLQLFSGSQEIVAIPLALAMEGTFTMLFLGGLFWLVVLPRRLRLDPGMARLQRRHLFLQRMAQDRHGLEVMGN